MFQVFLTGATGFIGGDVLYLLSTKHPEWQISCMVRSIEKGKLISTLYPQHRIVYGDNNSVEVIENESARADLVIHCGASDEDMPSALAISRGLAKSGSGTWIHTSGALALASRSVLYNQYGTGSDKVFDDWDNIKELVTRDDNEPHARVDNTVLRTGNLPGVNVAIVAPSVVYGETRGSPKERSFWPWNKMVELQQFFVIGSGENIWHYVHVRDLSEIYLSLSEAVFSGEGKALWGNENGYYLAEQGHFIAKDFFSFAAREAYDRGLVGTPEVASLSVDEAESIMPWSRFMVGADSRGLAIRARKLLGWCPRRYKLEDQVLMDYEKQQKEKNMEKR